MKRALLTMCVSAALVLVTVWDGALAEEKAPPVKTAQVGELVIAGPYVHKNLAVFLILGADQVKGKTFLTLDEALERKVAVVYETGDVGELAVENKSATHHIYIQSGVIVKGGKQDRTIRFDIVLPPASGKVQLSSFCVEAGRWRQRGAEAAANFNSAKANLATKELKLAAKLAGSQQEVWNNVAKTQTDLGTNLNANVRSAASGSSLQLTLENEDVQKAVTEYTAVLAALPAAAKDAVGYAFAINGEVNSADVYGSAELFRKLWPRLIEASATEAIASVQKGKTFTAPGPDAVKALMLDAQKGKSTKENLTEGAKTTILESKGSVLLRVADPAKPNDCIRAEYFKN